MGTRKPLIISSESRNPNETQARALRKTGELKVVQQDTQPSASDETVVLSPDDIEYFEGAEFVASELADTNRELMRLVDGVLARWTEANSERGYSDEETKLALNQALQVQQCLAMWQDHASRLERDMMDQVHTVTRALDIADEVLSARWMRKKRRHDLKDRLTALRTRRG